LELVSMTNETPTTDPTRCPHGRSLASREQYPCPAGLAGCSSDPDQLTATTLPGLATSPAFLLDLLREVRAARTMIACWPPSEQTREACESLAHAAAAVQDAQTALGGA
jgi:hypothetical protein